MLPPDLAPLAADQHGLVSRPQLAAAGLTRAAIRHLIDRHALVPLGRDALVVAGAPRTTMQHALAAVLDVGHGAAIGLWSAASLWGVQGFRPAPFHVVRGRGGHARRSPLAVVHTSTVLHDGHIGLVGGIRVTTPARTVCDLAAHLHPGRVEWLCDRLWAMRLLPFEELTAVVDELARPGCRGSAVLRSLVDARGPDHRAPESGLERRLAELLRRDGQPPLDPQVDLGDESGWIGRVDFADRRARVVVEVQSSLHHGSLVDRARDRDRRRRLEAAGWLVVEVWELELWHDPQPALDRIRAARGHRPRLRPRSS